MKIIYLNYLYDMKESSVGASVHVKELEKALKECKHEVKTFNLMQFTSEEASVKSNTRYILKKKFGRYLNQINNLIANGKYFFKEWKIVSEERPDIILVRYQFLHFVLEVNAPIAY
jgi:hypothetical protein